MTKKAKTGSRRKLSVKQKIAQLPIPDRISTAKRIVERVVDHLLYVLELHENNAIVLYSQTLSSQIPTSHAANAFIVCRNGLHQFEIVRLCALWDSADLQKENIPTLIELTDDPDVIETLAQETLAYHVNQAVGRVFNATEDADIHEFVLEAHRLDNIEQGEQNAQRVRDDLRQAVSDSRAILASSKHTSIMNLRDKHLAHSLTETNRERKNGPYRSDEIRRRTRHSQRHNAHCSKALARIAGKGFDFENSRRIDRNNAQSLWGACTFKIER